VSARYAIYYAPRPNEPLARFSRRWLGWDPELACEVEQPADCGLPAATLARITTEPRRYGFHGTWKAPFELAPSASPDTVLTFAADFARRRTPFVIDRLRLAVLDGFLALVPADRVPALEEVAAACVREFDPFRAAVTPADLARRRVHGLTRRQDELLARWGYPFVMEEFRFHLTLTARLHGTECEVVRQVLETQTAPFCGVPIVVRDVAVFIQDDRSAPFRTLARFPFAAGL